MTKSYRNKHSGAGADTTQAEYLKKVVKQPTKQSNVKVKMDKKSPTGISRVRGKAKIVK